MIDLQTARERLLAQHREELECIDEAIRLCGVLETRNGEGNGAAVSAKPPYLKSAAELPVEFGDIKPRAVKVRADKGKKNPRKATCKAGGETLRIAAIAAGMDWIAAPSLAKEAGIDLKKASNFITGAKSRGWVKQLGFGKYQATAKMPRGASEPQRHEDTGFHVEREQRGEERRGEDTAPYQEPSQQVRHLEEELARTEKELVHAIAKDQETLKVILKDKVGVIEAKLKAARRA